MEEEYKNQNKAKTREENGEWNIKLARGEKEKQV